MTGISVPVAIVFAGVAVFDGRLLFILPTIFLVVLGSPQSVSLRDSFVLASSTVGRQTFHRSSFWLLLLNLLLSIAIILAVLFGP